MGSVIEDVKKYLEQDQRYLPTAYQQMALEAWNMFRSNVMTKEQIVMVCATLIRLYDERPQAQKHGLITEKEAKK